MTKEESLQWEEEYNTKIKFFKTDYIGKMHIPTNVKFHPNLFQGTEKEYSDMITKHFQGKEDEFKITGSHSFYTFCEYNKIYNKLLK